MDHPVIRKRLSTFKTEKGTLNKVSDEVVIEVLTAWENWTGTIKDLYRELDMSKMQMDIMIKKGKKLRREGHFTVSEFKEIKVEDSPSNLTSLTSGPCHGVEILWDGGKLIRFAHVEQLIDFLKKYFR